MSDLLPKPPDSRGPVERAWDKNFGREPELKTCPHCGAPFVRSHPVSPGFFDTDEYACGTFETEAGPCPIVCVPEGGLMYQRPTYTEPKFPESLEIGDTVIIDNRWHRRIVKVDGITPTGIIKIGKATFSKDGFLRGRSHGDVTMLREATPEMLESVRREIWAGKIAALSTDDLRGIPAQVLFEFHRRVKRGEDD